MAFIRSYGHQGDMPKCPYYQGVRIRYKVKDKCFIDKKTEADIFTAHKMLKGQLTDLSARSRALLSN